MMKAISLALLMTTLSGCSFFHIHKLDVEQGNVISQENVNLLHHGMTKSQVEDLMGAPLLVNLFANNRMEYIYTMQVGSEERKTTKISCIFVNGRLQQIVRG